MRGGFREGAGRPTKPENEKRVKLICSVSPDTRETVDWLKAHNVRIGPEVDRFFKRLKKKVIQDGQE